MTSAELGSTQKAAGQLGVSRQAVSRTLQKFEEEIGQTLFIRQNNSLMLTDFGRLFLPDALRLTEEFASAEEKLREYSRNYRTVFRLDRAVGMHTELVGLLREYRRANSDWLDLLIYDRTSYDCERDLAAGKADCILVHTPSEKLEIAETYILCEEPIRLAVGKTHPLAFKETITLQDVESTTLFHYTGGIEDPYSIPRRPWDSHPNRVLSNDLSFLQEEVMAGKGVMPSGSITNLSSDAVVFRPLPPEYSTYPSVTRLSVNREILKDVPKARVVRDLVSLCGDALRELMRDASD